MHQKYPSSLKPLVEMLKKIPGVGTRTAEKFSFELLSWQPDLLQEFGSILQNLHQKLPPCHNCGCITENSICLFCDNLNRDRQKLCIVASPKEVFPIEETHSFKGLYHVIEHLISPLDGRLGKEINLEKIQSRILENNVTEILLAFDSTLEGDATAIFLKNRINQNNIQFTRFAFGLPMGSSLEYIDGATLSRALKSRQNF